MTSVTKTLCAAAALAAIAVLAGCAGPEVAASGPEVRTTSAGRILVDSAGMTLYSFDRDTVGKPTCTGTCALAWPPAKASDKATPSGGFTLVARDDGARQWAYRGKPLYGYTSDSKPGDVKGDGKSGVWHVVHP